ncbi:MAG: hypothetical protein LIO57_07940, partial [Oscillospiraceae bacterium]|nr:hypothetical protein [Oscillospiraceae bacterium]
MKAKRMKQFLSLVLSLAMALSLSALPAWADEGDIAPAAVEAVAIAEEALDVEIAEQSAAAADLQAQIDALPSVSEVAAITDSYERLDVYYYTSDLWDAYYELSEDEQSTVNTSVLEALSDYFNGMVSTVADTVTLPDAEDNVITLDKDYAITSPYVVSSGEVTIDLNGHSITRGNGNEKSYLIGVASGGTLIVKDSQSGGKITSSNFKKSGDDETTYAGYGILVNGMVTVESGTISGYYGIYVSGDSASLTVSGGTVSGTNRAINLSSGSVEVSGGAITGDNYGLIQFGGIASISGGTVSGYYDGAYVTGASSELTVEGTAVVKSTCTADNSNDEYYTATAAISIYDGASVTIENGTITGGYCGVAFGQGNSADSPSTLVVNGGDITGLSLGVSTNGSKYYHKIIVNGGTISGSYGMYLPGMESTTTINGGTITGSGTGIEIRAGALTVTGGTIIGNGTPESTEANGNGTTVYGAGIAVSQHTTKKDVTVTITGGEITGYTGLYEINYNSDTSNAGTVTVNIKAGEDSDGNTTTPTITATGDGASAVYSASVSGVGSTGAYGNNITSITISSGTYNTDVSAYAATDYKAAASADGTWSVISESYLTSITDSTTGITTYYKNLSAAITAAKDGDTIELVGDVILSEDLVVNKSCAITLDLVDDNLTIDDGVALTVSAGTTVTIINSKSTGIVYNNGTIAVNGTLDISELGYTTDTTSGGLMGGLSGKIAMGTAGTFIVPDEWGDEWATSLAAAYKTYASDTTDTAYIGYADCGDNGIWTPNIPTATGASGIFASAEAGATVVSGENTWICNTAFSGLTANPTALYWIRQSLLEVTDVTFNATYGDTPTAQAITIENTSANTASITGVTVDSENFTIGGEGNSIESNKSISTWTVQPKSDLAVGSYTATITVTDSNNTTATAAVSFTVNQATLAESMFKVNTDDETYSGSAITKEITT